MGSKCYFCGSPLIRLPWVSICMGGYGTEYDFCGDCLDNLSADEFWKAFYESYGYSYPPKLNEEAQKFFDDGKSAEDYHTEHWGKADKPDRIEGKAGKHRKQRELLTNKFRYEILKRDKFRCQICGRQGRDVRLEIDHMTPISKGGLTVEENLWVLCYECNRGKFVDIIDEEDMK